MMDTLKQLGVDWRDRRLIWELYIKQQAVVRVADEYTDTCSIGRGVRQGCSLSPLLFSIYAERMMVEALDGVDEGVKVGGSLLKDIRFADDQGMVAETERGLQIIMNRLNDASKEYGMKINIKKTKVMKVSKQGGGNVNIVLNEERIKQVRKFRYLGSLITDNGSCSKEIKARIGMAKTAFNRRRELLTRSISRKVKKKIIKTVIWRVFLYGSETWSLKMEDIKRIEAFEMWIWRRMEKVSWVERKTNEEVLIMVEEKRELLDRITNTKKRWIGHIIRGNGLLKEVIEGRIDGKRPKGRKRIGMLSGLKEDGYASMKRRTDNRESWRNWMPRRTCQQTEH